MSSFFIDNTVQEDDYSGFSPIPAGVYIARVESAEVKPTKTGGEKISVQFSVADGQYANRRVWANINTRNQSTEAQAIGQRQLRSFARAVGCPDATTTDPFLGKYCKIKVKIRKDEQWGDSNDITGYEMLDGTGQQQAAFKSPPPAQKPAAAAPWAAR